MPLDKRFRGWTLSKTIDNNNYPCINIKIVSSIEKLESINLENPLVNILGGFVEGLGCERIRCLFIC